MEKKSFGYAALRAAVKWMHDSFYASIEHVGQENLPNAVPTLIVANHQNALMDPLAIICSSNLQPIFLTRADIFSNALVRGVFSFFRMLPIYRQHDGGNVVKRNEQVFERISQLLAHRQAVALFPEATLWAFRRLKPLKKGAARMAFLAEERSGWTLGLQIVPTGIYYSNYTKAMSHLRVEYGKPFGIAHWRAVYEQDKDEAIRQLTKEIEQHLLPLIIHIDQPTHYNTINDVSQLLAQVQWQPGHGQTQFELQRTIGQSLARSYTPDREKDYAYLAHSLAELNGNLRALGLRPWLLSPTPKPALVPMVLSLIVLFPIYILSLLFNVAVVHLPNWQTKATVKDTGFHASFKFGLAVLYSLLSMAIGGGILTWLTSSVWIGLLLVVVGMALAPFVLRFEIKAKKTWALWRYQRLAAQGKLTETKVALQCIVGQVEHLMATNTDE